MAIPQMSVIDVIKFKRSNFSFKTENKACYVLACRIEGESLFFYNDEKHVVKKGDVLFIPAGSSYAQACEREIVVCFHLNITGQVASDIKVFSPKERDKVCELFFRAEQIWKQKEPNYEFLCMSILYEILADTQICITVPAQDSAKLLVSAMSYLDKHLFDGDLSLAQVCKEAHISRTYFNKLFCQIYGCTPTAYINRQRMERAKQLLVIGSCSNEEIASLCGFKDVKYFYVIFKRFTGFTTKEYKKEYDKLKSKNFVVGK